MYSLFIWTSFCLGAAAIDDLPLDLSVLYRLIDRVVDQFPILRDIAIREHRGSLPTMTADGEHIVGPLAAPSSTS